jgi:tryptophan-rich sensory protein
MLYVILCVFAKETLAETDRERRREKERKTVLTDFWLTPPRVVGECLCLSFVCVSVLILYEEEASKTACIFRIWKVVVLLTFLYSPICPGTKTIVSTAIQV